MLHPVAQLPQHVVGHIRRVLRDEEHAHTLGPDQAGDLFDLVHQHLRRAVEQQMRLVEEEYELRLVGVADLWQHLEQFRQQPQQEGRVKLGRAHQLVGGQDVDLPAPVGGQRHHVGQFQRRFAEQRIAALVLQHEQLTLDRADRTAGDIAVAQRQVLRVLPDPDQQRLQVLEVQQRQPFFVGHAEGDVQHPFLHVRQFQQARQQQRPHLGHGGADRVALLAQQIPEGHGKSGVVQVKPDGRGALRERLVQFVVGRAGGRQPRQIALHVRQEHRHTGGREAFGQDLQRHGLAGAGGPRDQPVTIGLVQQHDLRLAVILAATADEDAVRHDAS